LTAEGAEVTKLMHVLRCAALSTLLVDAAGVSFQQASAAPVQAHTAEKQNDKLADPNAEPAQAVAKPMGIGADVDLRLTEQGLGMYKAYCQKCHGLQMVTPGGGFYDLRTFPLDDKARFVDSVMNGKRAMPAWGSVFKPGDVEALWAYVASYQLARDAKAKPGAGK
jgi:mono/diheme cytochrome c family protein